MTKVADLSIVELERRGQIARRAIESGAGLLTSRQAAEIIGCTEAQLSHWLTGRDERPDGLPQPLNGEKIVGGRRSNRPRNWIAAEVIAYVRRRDLAAAGEAICDRCDGTGRRSVGGDSESYTFACRDCFGRGIVSTAPTPPPPSTSSLPCPHCKGAGFTLGYRTGGGITPGMRPDVRRTCAWCRGLGRVRDVAERPKLPAKVTGSDFSTSSEVPKSEQPRQGPKLMRASELVKTNGGSAS